MSPAKSKSDRALRAEVVHLLDAGNAHLRAKDVFARVTVAQRGKRPAGFAHSPWELLEHLRIAQADILDWTLDPKTITPPWPEGFWPATPAPPSARAWEKSARAFLRDLHRAAKLAADPRRDLLAPLAHSPDASLLGQLLLLATHNSYHLGQLVDAQRALAGKGKTRRG